MAEHITDEQKLKCAERELQMRKRVYPRWVSQGRMTAQKAADEIAIMEAIVADYQEAVKQERLL